MAANTSLREILQFVLKSPKDIGIYVEYPRATQYMMSDGYSKLSTLGSPIKIISCRGRLHIELWLKTYCPMDSITDHINVTVDGNTVNLMNETQASTFSSIVAEFSRLFPEKTNDTGCIVVNDKNCTYSFHGLITHILTVINLTRSKGNGIG